MSPDWCWPRTAYAEAFEQLDGCQHCGDALCDGECEDDSADELHVGADD